MGYSPTLKWEVLGAFPIVMIKHPDQKQLRGERVYFSSQFRVTDRKSKQQEADAVCPITSPDKNREE